MENILIEDRKKILIKGAKKVLSTTSNQAVVEVEDCNIIITGNNIEVTKLDLENKEVVFSGELTNLKYSKKVEKTNIIKRLFK